MTGNPLIVVFLPIALGIVMAGLGLHLSLADFRRVWRMPRAMLVALAVQTLTEPVFVEQLDRRVFEDSGPDSGEHVFLST
jgi:predicted Na+-dependent transporter